MPNWVYNTLTIEGEPQYVTNLIEELAKPYVQRFTNFDNKLVEETVNVPFSFWNIISPPEDKLDEYFGTHGAINGEKVGDTDYNWYNWNNMNWGCKWDASDVTVETVTVDNTKIIQQYSFSTPWSFPYPVINRLAEDHPTLLINLEYEEEQGWGGGITWENGQTVESYEYDIPNSHDDYRSLGKECYCEYMDDSEWWYKDCPDIDTNKYEWNEVNKEWILKIATTENVE